MLDSARTMTANFGFSFALTALSNTQPEIEEPLAKRRKTIEPKRLEATLTRHIHVGSEPMVEVDHDKDSIPQPKKRPRRQLPTEAAEDKPNNPPHEPGEDSFVDLAKSKTTRNTTRATYIHPAVSAPDVFHSIALASKAGRPRRRAAANAIQKVIDDFTEEAEPIDKVRRRETGIEGAGRDDGREGRHGESAAENDGGLDELHNLVMAEKSKQDSDRGEIQLAKNRRQRQLKKRASTKTVNREDVATNYVSDSSRPSTEKQTTPKRRSNDAAPSLIPGADQPVQPNSKQQQATVFGQTHLHDEQRPHTSKHNEVILQETADDETAHRRPPAARRPVLKETDINISRHSFSPEKCKSRDITVRSPENKAKASLPKASKRQEAPVSPAKSRAANKRRVPQVARDEVIEVRADQNARSQRSRTKCMRVQPVDADAKPVMLGEVVERGDVDGAVSSRAVDPDLPDMRNVNAEATGPAKRKKVKGASTTDLSAADKRTKREQSATLALQGEPAKCGNAYDIVSTSSEDMAATTANRRVQSKLAASTTCKELGSTAATPDEPRPQAVATQPEAASSAPLPTPSPGAQQSVTQTKRKKQSKSTSPNRKKTQPASGQESCRGLVHAKDDEDIDWLFEAQAPARAPPVSSKTALVQGGGRKALTKLADLDLDDLIANITSLANASSGTVRKGRLRK